MRLLKSEHWEEGGIVVLESEVKWEWGHFTRRFRHVKSQLVTLLPSIELGGNMIE